MFNINAQSKLGLSSFIPTNFANLPVPIHMLWPCLHPNQLFFCRPVPRPILIKQRRHCLVPMHGCFLHWQVVNLLLDSVKYIKIIVFYLNRFIWEVNLKMCAYHNQTFIKHNTEEKRLHIYITRDVIDKWKTMKSVRGLHWFYERPFYFKLSNPSNSPFLWKNYIYG